MGKQYVWKNEKNEKLKIERNISFEDVVVALANNQLLDDKLHPNQERYKYQRVYIVEIKNYVYFVPYRETENEVLLITIIPSRKDKRNYGK